MSDCIRGSILFQRSHEQLSLFDADYFPGAHISSFGKCLQYIIVGGIHPLPTFVVRPSLFVDAHNVLPLDRVSTETCVFYGHDFHYVTDQHECHVMELATTRRLYLSTCSEFVATVISPKVVQTRARTPISSARIGGLTDAITHVLERNLYEARCGKRPCRWYHSAYNFQPHRAPMRGKPKSPQG